VQILLELMESAHKGVALKAGAALESIASRNPHLRHFILDSDALPRIVAMITAGVDLGGVGEAMTALIVRVVGSLAGLWPLGSRHAHVLSCPEDEFRILVEFADRWQHKPRDCSAESFLTFAMLFLTDEEALGRRVSSFFTRETAAHLLVRRGGMA
jgi:hypothetical protein